MGYDRILAAVDASPLQLIVFEQALKMAKLYQAELKLLHCIEVDINPVNPSVVPVVGTPAGASCLSPSAADCQVSLQVMKARLNNAKQWLQEYCHTAVHQGVKASFGAIIGNPANQVCNLAKHARPI